jgi:hypothetical protein
MALAGIDLDAFRDRMKRLSFLLFFIDAGHKAAEQSALAAASLRCPRIVPTFPDSGNAQATLGISFTHDDCPVDDAIAIMRSRGVYRPRAAGHEAAEAGAGMCNSV